MENLIIVHGGELAADVAEQLAAKKPSKLSALKVTVRNASERPKTLLEHGKDTIVCFVMQTIENSNPTEEVRTVECSCVLINIHTICVVHTCLFTN